MNDMERLVDRLRSERYRNSTRETYYHIWKICNKFFLRLDVKPDTWEQHLVLFVGFLVEGKLKSTTIRSYISAIKGILLENKITMNCDELSHHSQKQAK